MRLGTNRKIFSLGIAAVPLLSRARSGGASSVPAPLRGLTLRPGASAAPTARRTPLPQAGLRCYSSLQAGAWAAPDVRGARGGGRTHPALPMGRRWPPPARQALQPPAAVPAAQLCSASGNLLFRARACKIGKRRGGKKERLKENGTGPFKICLLPFPFVLSAPFHRVVPKYRGRRGAKKHQRRVKEGTEQERSKEKEA